MNTPALLGDYLDRPDFGRALRELAGPLAAELDLPERVDEVGLVCPNVLAAARELERRWPKMTTFLLGAGSPTVFVENGNEVPFATRVGFGFYDGVILELAEPGAGSEIFGQTPNPDGQIVVNHLGFVARGPSNRRSDGGVDRAFADVMAQRGVKKRVDAVLNLLGVRGHIYIYEAIARTRGVEIEFLDFRLFSENGPKIDFPHTLSGLIGWWQKHIGPRFISLPATIALPPAGSPGTGAL